MPLRHLLKARTNGRGVGRPSALQVLEALLPELLDIRKMTDVLGNRPFPFELKASAGVGHADKERGKPRQHAAKAFDEVRQHPWRGNQGELPLRPQRTLEV